MYYGVLNIMDCPEEVTASRATLTVSLFRKITIECISIGSIVCRKARRAGHDARTMPAALCISCASSHWYTRSFSFFAFTPFLILAVAQPSACVLILSNHL